MRIRVQWPFNVEFKDLTSHPPVLILSLLKKLGKIGRTSVFGATPGAFQGNDLNPPKRPVVRPNAGNQLRKRAKTPRDRFLETDVTKEEQQEILDYCLKHKISVSEFLADLILQDAVTAKSRPEKVLVKAEFELSHEEHYKLELLARLYKKEDIGQLIRELIQPNLDLQRLHVARETRTIRFYLSKQKHELATKHMASRGIAARKYASFLALKAIEKDRKKHT